MDFHLHPLGDQAVIIELGDDITIKNHEKVKVILGKLETLSVDWLLEYVPAFTTVAVYYDPIKIGINNGKLPYDFVCDYLISILKNVKEEESVPSKVVEIPVCYGGEIGPDLPFVAEHNQLSENEVIDIHTKGEYLVYMIGFAPGFPYLGGMSEKIAAPRKDTPRLKIPEGSVGIAGKQTGVYPIETPGGWQLIGRTPLKLFRPNEEHPSLLKAGDRIKFNSISFEYYQHLKEDMQ
ncbi:5-oxoprolinase subunit PxpB [Metabacillus arenae]|nr:5-oxoprolinase subunit PxpB [Metabacillus arenae]